MSSIEFEAPLRVRPEASWLLAVILTGAHVLALATLSVLVLPQALKLAMGVVVLSSLCRAIYTRVLLRGPRAIRAIVWGVCGDMVVRDGADREYQAQAAFDSFAHPWAIVLNLRLNDSSRRTLVLLPDSVPKDVFRQLRVRLRQATKTDQTA